MPDDDSIPIAVELRGSALDAETMSALLSARVEESVHLPDAVELVFSDPDFSLVDSGMVGVGDKVTVSFPLGAELLELSEVEVTALEVRVGSTGLHEFVVRGLDASHRFGRGVHVRTFVDMSDSDIVEQILETYPGESKVTSTKKELDFVHQTGVTDLRFLTDRARRNDFDFWVADGVAHFAPRPEPAVEPPELSLLSNVLSIEVSYSSAERCDDVTIRGWDPVAAKPIIGRGSSTDLGSNAPFGTDASAGAERAFGKAARQLPHAPVRTQEEADQLAQSLAKKAAAAELQMTAEVFGDPRLRCGAEVQIDDAGEALSGTYLLTAVRHRFSRSSGYRTEIHSGGREPAELVDLAGSYEASVPGPVVGLVTDIEDPDGLGRVKVKFPTMDDQSEGWWARTLGLGAGKNRGLHWLPEAGDEVLVVFEGGDATRPVVLGGLWSQPATAPVAKGAKNSGSESLLVASPAGSFVELVADKPVFKPSKPDEVSHLVLSPTEMTLHAADKLKITVKGDLSFDVKGDLAFGVEGKVQFSAGGAMKLQGKTIELN